MSLKPTRPTTKRGIGNSPAVGTNTMRAVCGHCGKTVWTWQASTLSTGKTLGIVHTDTNDCEEA